MDGFPWEPAAPCSLVLGALSANVPAREMAFQGKTQPGHVLQRGFFLSEATVCPSSGQQLAELVVTACGLLHLAWPSD